MIAPDFVHLRTLRPGGSLRRLNYPPAVRDVLEQYGNEQIDAVRVVRKPIMPVLSGIIDLISLGQFTANKSQLGYDDMYHLYLFVRLRSGTIIRLEKNQVFNFTPEISFETGNAAYYDVYTRRSGLDRFKNRGTIKYTGAESLKVNTLNEMLSAAHNAFPDLFPGLSRDDWWLYSGYNNNCQVFVFSCVYALGCADMPGIHEFIMQDTRAIIGSLNAIARAIMQGATDSAAIVDKLIYGQGK